MDLIRRTCLLALCSAVLVLAASSPFEGTWEGTAESGADIKLVLTAEAETLSGTISLNAMPPKQISKGRVQGSAISFKMPSMMGASTHDVEGVLKEGKLALKIKSANLGETPVELTKR